MAEKAGKEKSEGPEKLSFEGVIFAVVNGGRQVRQGVPLETYTATVAEIIVDGVPGEAPSIVPEA